MVIVGGGDEGESALARWDRRLSEIYGQGQAGVRWLLL